MVLYVTLLTSTAMVAALFLQGLQAAWGKRATVERRDRREREAQEAADRAAAAAAEPAAAAV